MVQIYEQHLWGGQQFDYYSGFGSHNPKLVEPYLEAVIDFLRLFQPFLTVCDLGCGDFNIGRHLIKYTSNYIGIDIVESLIERNKLKFRAENLEFKCLDISKDKLPKADCVILRNVLQHLSNAEIQNILYKLKNYKYLILTEHLPSKEFVPNTDIIAGQGIRLKKNSGVDILQHPFHFQIKNEKTLLKLELTDDKGIIVTMLYEVF